MQRRANALPRFYLVLIVVMLVCFSLSFAVAQVRYVQASRRVNALALERLALSNQVKNLSARLDYVRTDAYVERVARDELNMLMPGEIRYVSN